MMEANKYQLLTHSTEIYSKASKRFIRQIKNNFNYPDQFITPEEKWLSLAYCAGKINGEAGEVSELIFKALRDGDEDIIAGSIDNARRDKLFKELGDVLWYVSEISTLLGFNLSEIMEANIAKLADRKERGVLSGSGDER